MASKKLIGHYYGNNAIIGNIPQQAQKENFAGMKSKKGDNA